MTPTPASQPLFPGLAELLHSVGEQVGDQTPLGAALMDPRSATWLVFLIAAGSLLWLLHLAVQRSRLRQESRQLQALMQAARNQGQAADDGSDRTHREALSALYDMTPAALSPEPASAAQDPVMPARSLPGGDSNRLEPVLRQEASPVLPASSVTELFRSTPQPVAAMPLSAAAQPEVVPALATAIRDVSTGVQSMARNDQDDQHRESASVRLLTAAVDRLLQRVESQQAQIHELVSELKSQSSAVVLQGERLMALEAHVTGLVAEPEPEAVEQPLEEAISSAAQGLSTEELVSRFGLSEAEARLIHLVHGGDAAASGRSRPAPAGLPQGASGQQAAAPAGSGFAVPQADGSLTGTDASRG